MKLYFITGNKAKFEEVKSILPLVEQMDIDLPEIQEIDAREIIRKKLLEALNHAQGEFIVEDTSLYLECLKGLPGPLIKWFLKTIGNSGLAQIAEHFKNTNAEARTIVGYAKNHEEIYFFEGVIRGIVVMPRGSTTFDWDVIFQPEGYSQTFAEMGRDEKNKISIRKLALDKLRGFLENPDEK